MIKPTSPNKLNSVFIQDYYVQAFGNEKELITNMSVIFTKSPKETDKYMSIRMENCDYFPADTPGIRLWL